MASPTLPPSLQGVFFDVVWDKKEVWALTTPVSSVPLTELEWHLDLTVWSTVMGEARFDLAPRTVLARPDDFPAHWKRLDQVDMAYPLEMFRKGARWVILDGYHRLAKASVHSVETIKVRLHPDDAWNQIVRRRAPERDGGDPRRPR